MHTHPGGSAVHVMSAETSVVRVGFSYRTPLDEETPWDVSATRAAGLHDLADVSVDYRDEVTTTRARLMRGGACDADAAEADVRLEVEALEDYAYPADLSSPADADPALFLAAPGCALLRWTVAGETLAPYLGVAARAAQESDIPRSSGP